MPVKPLSVQNPRPRQEETPVQAEDEEEGEEEDAETDDEASEASEDLTEDQASLRRSSHAAPSLSNVRRLFNPRSFVPVRVNSVISKRYTIEAKAVGQGGYGKVYVGEDKMVKGRRVAIKKIVADSREMRRAYQNEVDLMKALDHPNICKILETYENGRTLWVVMEYCEGGEVYAMIKAHQKIDEDTTASIIQQVVRALLYAHSHNIAHRDLKPENVCFCEDGSGKGQVKVIDWGVGCHFEIECMNSAVGSATYAAPEVLQSDKTHAYAAACDLWSLGVMTYVMLCGKPPFWGQEQLKKMMEERYPMHDATWKATSAEAKDFIRGLLKADPTKRLSLQECMRHPWLRQRCRPAVEDVPMSLQVLRSMTNFTKTTQIYSIIAAAVAKQLDHRSLEEIRKVFLQMDANGDGVLELEEVRAAYARTYGRDSRQLRHMEEFFKKLDLDGNGKIEWTEFCAACHGGLAVPSEDAMRLAFKAFDIDDDNNRLSKAEFLKVLEGADIGKAWSKEICHQVVEEIFVDFDTDGDGTLDFQEFKSLVASSQMRSGGELPAAHGQRPTPTTSGRGAAAAGPTAAPPTVSQPTVPPAADSGRTPTLLTSKRMREQLGLGLGASKSREASSELGQSQEEPQEPLARGKSLLNRLQDAILRPNMKQELRRPTPA